jgi:ABC-2 type transport system permease protein
VSVKGSHPYLAVLGTRFRARIQYRAAAFAGVVTQFFWGFIRIMILEAFYRSGGEPASLSFEEAVAYVWLGQAFLGLLPWNIDPDIDKMIDDGGVAYEMLRPLDLYAFWYVRTIAWRVANTLLRCVPLLLFAYLVLPLIGLGSWTLSLPPTWLAGLAFIASMILAVFLGAAFTTLSQTLLFWTVSGRGVQNLMGPLIMIASGMIIPLPLFPDWAQPILRALPFHAIVDAPFRIYSGNIAGSELVFILFLQIAWIVGLVFIGRYAMSRGKNRLVVQGG